MTVLRGPRDALELCWAQWITVAVDFKQREVCSLAIVEVLRLLGCMNKIRSGHGILRTRRFFPCRPLLLCVIFAITGLIQPSPSHADLCIASVVEQNSPFHFFMSLTDGLGYAQTSIQRFNEGTHASPKGGSLLSMLSVVKLAKADLECAESQLGGYRTSAHAPIRQSAEATASVFARLSSLQGQTLFDFRAAIDAGPDGFDLGTFVTRQTARIAAVDEEWKGLVPAVVLAAHMVTGGHSSTGPPAQATLTPIQRAEIRQRLRAIFGENITKGAARGQKAVAAAGAVLFEALNNQQHPIRP